MPQPETVLDLSATAPPTLDHVVGQRQAVQVLRVALSAYWNDHAAGQCPCLGPILMEGPPGTGKTLLGGIIARELGGILRETLGQTLGMGGDDLHELLLEATDDTVLFIDECQLMNPYAQTIVLRAMEERKLLVPKGPLSKKYTSIPLSRFTTLFATTNPEGLIAPLRERMKIVLQFGYYGCDDLALLCSQRARALGWNVEPEVFSEIAKCAKQTPRQTLRLLESCRRTARAVAADTVTMAHFERTIELEGLDRRLGLDRNEQAYLRALAEANGKLRLGSLALKLGLPPHTLSAVTERFIVRQGLVERTGTGRELTPKGREFARDVPADRQ